MKNTLVILTILIGSIFAENPTLNVQGVLRDVEGAAVPDGENYQLTFYLYDAVEGGSSIWSEDHIGVSVANGVYSAELGGTASLGGLPFSVPYYLGIAVNGGQESTPRIPLSMSPYALSVRGTTNTFPNDGNVIVGNDLNVTGETTLNNYWHFENTNELNADGTMYLNYGGNDVDISHTGGTTTTGGDLNVGGNVKVNNHIMNDANGDYDVWIQGSTGSTNAGDDRNLAILGYSDDSYDALILNYNNEYENGVRVQSKLQVDGSIQVGGGSVLGGIETGSIGSGSPGSTGPKYFVANHWRQL